MVQTSSVDADNAMPRLLFVDDEPGIRAAFSRTMGAKGFLVDLAADGDEAMWMAARHPYAVVATDLSMPGLDGFSMIEQVRGALPDTVFVVITGKALSDVSPVRTSDGSICRIIQKPWDNDDLADALRRAFEIYRERKKVEIPPPRVLVVENDPAVVAMVWNALDNKTGLRFRVENTSKLADAEQLLTDSGYEAIITEIGLDGATGPETLRRLHAVAPLTPLVVLTAKDDLMAPAEAIRLGAQDYLRTCELGTLPLDRAIFFAIERKGSERKLAHLANHDHLTGLPTRALFQERLGRTLTRAKRRNEGFGVVHLDLDRFRSLNDALGQEGGDVVLVEVARRLQALLESTEGLARLGADEFAFVYEGADVPSAYARLGQRALETLRQPIVLDGTEVTVTASIGIALYPENGATTAELIASAETALMQAKGDGRDSYRLFGDRMQSDALAQIKLESQLRRALEHEEFRLHYQPQFELETGNLVGVEALLRWQKDGELIPPFKFIPTLEDTSLIVPVGAWVLERACKDLRAMHERYGRIRMAVNLSARQFEREGLVEAVCKAVDGAGIPYDCLELEITESLLMKDVARTVTILSALKDGGCRIAIDDFGTGYSSLAYLRRFPVDVLKIDRSFVKEATEDKSITAAVIRLGQSLGLEMVAEGVEEASQLLRLRSEGCDLVQGYYCGRPVAFDGKQVWQPLAIVSSIDDAREARTRRSSTRAARGL
jgi:diguanylate cyclase (GGDEF)-like protein